MEVTQKQILMMYEILISSCPIVNEMAFSQETRKELANTILNQQDNKELLEINPDGK